MGVLGDKIGEGVVRYWPLTNLFFLLWVLTTVPILVKIDQEMRPWECLQTDRQIHRLTDANRFYNLSHTICYSYGTDKNGIQFRLTVITVSSWIVVIIKNVPNIQFKFIFNQIKYLFEYAYLHRNWKNANLNKVDRWQYITILAVMTDVCGINLYSALYGNKPL